MIEICRFFKLGEMWIYLVLGLIGLFFLRRLFQAIQEYRSSMFGMERSISKGHLLSASSALIILALLGVTEFAFVSYAGTVLLTAEILPTPTLNFESTQTPAQEPQPGIPSTPTEQVIGFDAGGGTGGGCMPGTLEWTDPNPGKELKGNVELKGSVSIADFGFYKYEYSQDNTIWNTIQAGTTVVTNGVLGNWDTSFIPPGDYTLRLVVSNNQGVALPPCTVDIKVVQAGN